MGGRGVWSFQDYPSPKWNFIFNLACTLKYNSNVTLKKYDKNYKNVLTLTLKCVKSVKFEMYNAIQFRAGGSCT